jgi:hypothetical protein
MTEDRQQGDALRGPGEWVLLSYRVPREPSTPRIAVWRKLKRLGAAHLSDGLVTLPADADWPPPRPPPSPEVPAHPTTHRPADVDGGR